MLIPYNASLKISNKIIYYGYLRTNKDGTACEECLEEYELNEEGYYVDFENCEENKDNICIKCKEVNSWIGFCANNIFGCVKSTTKICLRCDDILDITNCTECNVGFKGTKYGKCEKEN